MLQPTEAFRRRQLLITALRDPASKQHTYFLGFWYQDQGPVCFWGLAARVWRQELEKEGKEIPYTSHTCKLARELSVRDLKGCAEFFSIPDGKIRWFMELNDSKKLTFEQFADLLEEDETLYAPPSTGKSPKKSPDPKAGDYDFLLCPDAIAKAGLLMGKATLAWWADEVKIPTLTTKNKYMSYDDVIG